jgi:hypothetical protein
MELIIIGTLTTIALLTMQAREYLRLRRAPHSTARYPEVVGVPPRRVLQPYVVKSEDEPLVKVA